ncbi:MAG TPA: phosphopentomutase [Clostridia bacterium]|nr:phosphopentomutase [Clostridia bacterium]
MTKRVIIFVLDSVGIGALPDAEKFGDIGVNTLGHIAENSEEFKIDHLKKLGIGNIPGLEAIEATEEPTAAFGRLAEVSEGKDTTSGHWEIAGLHLTEPFKTYPNGFPEEVIKKFEEATGRGVLCNKPASGTTIIKELGEKHMETGDVIVYTSADSVFQIAAHEAVVPLEELYEMCEFAREMLRGENQVARVIARPFVGEDAESFVRTSNRHDYSLDPFGKTILELAKDKGLDVEAVGKVVDIFNGVGITDSVHTESNMDGIDKTIEFLKRDTEGIIFTNLVDFDAKYGHRRNVEGYREALEAFDVRLPEILEALNDDDIIIFTADHGNDPTYEGTDHTREYVPALIYGKAVKAGANIGTRESFADIAATIADIFNIDGLEHGKSFKNIIMK